jgi:hypothetical protein
MDRNLTVQLDEDTVRKAEALAASRSMSVGQLVAEVITGLVLEDEGYKQARADALADLGVGFDLGSGGVLRNRDATHDR